MRKLLIRGLRKVQGGFQQPARASIDVDVEALPSEAGRTASIARWVRVTVEDIA